MGVAAALALTRHLESLLYGVRSRDAVVFIGVVLTVLVVSAAACLIPARRLNRVRGVIGQGMKSLSGNAFLAA